MSDQPVLFDDDNPEWSDADFARATRFDGQPLGEVAEILRRGRGRPAGATASTTKQLISLRIDRDVIARFRATGKGWQGRINETLRNASGG